MRANSERAGEAVGEVTAALLAGLARLTAHATSPAPASSAERIDRIAVMEQLRSALAAAQHAEMVAFGGEQVEEQIALVESGRLDPVALGRGIADQIVVSQTSHLDAEQRRLVDKQLGGAGVEHLSLRRAECVIKRCAYDADRAGYIARGRTARQDRRVGLRPAPDTMSVLTGFLPVEQGVACLVALRAHADTVLAAGDSRTRDQVMADTLIERVTGQATATDVSVEVGIVMPLDALLDPEEGGSAEIVGHGPIPAGIARDLLASTEGRLWWRRLFTAPRAGRWWAAAAPFRRGAGAPDHDPGRGPVPGPVLRRPDPASGPHRPAPCWRAHQLHQRARDVRARELRPRDARLTRRGDPRRARAATAHGAHHPPPAVTPTTAPPAPLRSVRRPAKDQV